MNEIILGAMKQHMSKMKPRSVVQNALIWGLLETEESRWAFLRDVYLR